MELGSGPFHVLCAAGDKAAREQMNQLEQFRHALGSALGKSDLHLTWQVEVIVFKNGRQLPPASPTLTLARDSYLIATTENAGVSPDRFRELARLFIEQNTSHLPVEIERGLLDLFSTLQVSGTHITLGTPIPAAARSRDWARMHLLNVEPAYAGRTRVLISNLEQGSDLDVGYRNAYEKSVAQIDKQLDAYVVAGTFGTTTISARPINAMRDFHLSTADADTPKLAIADLLLSTNSPNAESAYNALHGSDAAEGLGLLALHANKKAEAARLFASAIASETKNARVYFEAALLESDPPKARKQLARAITLNPAWGEPPYRLALLETDLDRRSELLKKATSLDPRKVEYWQALAKNETDAARFIDAQKAWGGAERAAATPEERSRIRETRLQLQGDRAEHEAAERRRKAEEEARDLERVKNASMAAIHEAESRTNKKLNPDGSAPPKALEWWNGTDASGKLEGTLQRFDCMGRQARLIIHGGDGKTVQLLVRDPSQIVLSGGGELTLACGPQKPPRKVLVLYNPKPDKKLGTAGEAASIEFR